MAACSRDGPTSPSLSPQHFWLRGATCGGSSCSLVSLVQEYSPPLGCSSVPKPPPQPKLAQVCHGIGSQGGPVFWAAGCVCLISMLRVQGRARPKSGHSADHRE